MTGANGASQPMDVAPVPDAPLAAAPKQPRIAHWRAQLHARRDTLRQAFNWALFRLWEKGRFSDLWLRYFPISPF